MKSTLNPEWPEMTVKIDELCNGDLNRPLLIEVWDWDKVGKHDLIGRFTTSMAQILSGVKEHKVIHPEKQAKKKHYSDSGSFTFTFKPIYQLNFLQLLNAGVQVNLAVAINLTKSNGAPTNPSSLHFINDQMLNEYQEALLKIGSLVCPYDADQRFALYGFGAQVGSNVHHCWPLSGTEEFAEVVGLQGLMDTYKDNVHKYEFSGPTLLAPFLRKCQGKAKWSKKQGSKTYYVALIITDSQIHDQEDTISTIVHSSDDPISIIIVGVGGDDFPSMEVLDGDDGVLKTKYGEKAKRDIVQFVPFSKHKDNLYALAQEVLAEVPKQLVDYYEAMEYVPQLPGYIQH